MPRYLKYEGDLNKIGKENWKELSELSDTPSDSRRNSIYTRDIEDSSLDKLTVEEKHREGVLHKIKEQETAIEKAREETKDRDDKCQLRLFISRARHNIPFGAIVKLVNLDSRGKHRKCRVIYQGIEYTTKQRFIKKIW